MIDVPLEQLTVEIPEDVREPFEKPPQGILEWEVKALRARMTEPQDTNQVSRLVLEAELVCLAPDQAAGIDFKESFWIGTDTDPQAQLPETWRTEAGKLVKFCDMSGFNARGATPAQLAGWLVGRKILSDCQHFAVNALLPNGQPNPRAFTQMGELKSRARMRWMEVGSATPIIYEDQDAKAGKGGSGGVGGVPGVPQAPPPMMSYPNTPLLPQGGGVPPTLPTPQAPQAPGVPHMPTPQAPVAHMPVSAPMGFPGQVPPAAPPAPRRR